MSIDQRESNLLEVSSLGNLKAAVQYIAGGVNPNCQHPMNKWTPLHWAVKRGHLPVVQYLLDNGGDPKIKNAKGETPLDLATSNEIRILFRDKVDDFTLTPISSSEQEDQQEDTKKVKFIPRYISEPDLLKVWGLPDDAVFNQDQQQSKQTPNKEEHHSQPDNTTNNNVVKKVEIIVFTQLESDKLEVLGGLPLLPTDKLTDILVKINEELQFEFQPHFKLYKYDKKEELKIPINQKQIYYTVEELFLLGNNKYYLIIKN